jgi:hypothetical protein
MMTIGINFIFRSGFIIVIPLTGDHLLVAHIAPSNGQAFPIFSTQVFVLKKD